MHKKFKYGWSINNRKYAKSEVVSHTRYTSEFIVFQSVPIFNHNSLSHPKNKYLYLK